VRLDPDDGKALSALVDIYAGLNRFEELARVLDLQVERVVADPAQQAEFLRQLARLVEGQLHDLGRARHTWEQLLDLLPTDAEALDSLARIYSSQADWIPLVQIMERQMPLAAEPGRAADIGLQRAQIFHEKLGDTDQAALALEQLVAEIDPRNVLAHERLRKYYEDDEDWPRVVKTAERQLYLTEDPGLRVPQAMELGALVRDKLGDDKKAIAIFERVLEMDAENMEALHEAADLYKKIGDYQRLAYANEKLLERESDADERRVLMLQIASLYETHLDDAPRGFEWYRRAYLETPDAEGLQLVDQAAERHGLFEELIQIYEGARARANEPMEQLAASLKIALICEEKLRDPARAFATLTEALPADPAGRELLPNLERLAEQTKDWRGLLDVYARVARARTEGAERVELLRLRAEVRERRMSDPSGALDEMLRSFALAPENAATQEEILRLARATGRWEEAIRVEGHLFALAESLPEKLEIARNAAYLVEHEVKDLVRAFRAYLNAFRLAPDDSEIVSHLWRLAAAIGNYHDYRAAALAAAAAPAAAAPAAAAETVASPDTAPGATDDEEDISVDVDDVDGEAPATVAAGAAGASTGEDADQPTPPPEVAGALLAEAMDASTSGAIRADDAIVEEAEADVIEELDDAELVEETPLPQPVARPPAPPPVARAAAEPQRDEEDERFATPWEELAEAYDALPAEDADTRRVYLRKIVEVWEKGQKDVDRALGALQRAFRLDIKDKEIRDELERVGGQYDRWDRVVEIYLGAIDEFGPIDTAVALHHDAARLRERLGQTDKAEALYDEILRLKSDDEVALAHVEEIYRSQQRWEDLANVLEKRTSAPTEALPLGPERRARLRELAGLYEDRLERPYEAIDTLERLLVEVADEERSHGEAATEAEVNEMLGAHEALARLYSRVGLWGKVVDSLKRQAELTPDPQRARALRLQVASVYEKELAVPERATEAYEAILASAPDDEEALAALDRLNEVHSRFEDLQEILEKRAAHATGKERIDLVRRRAKLLEEKLNNPEAAASALRELGTDAIGDDEMLAALLRNLRRAGLAHEASRALSQRIELERAKGGPESGKRVAELNLELSLLKLDDLHDPAAARKEVEAALEAAPENPAALAALAQLHLKQNDFASYAATRVREARALRGRADAIDALLDAGRVYREQVQAPDKARACFEEALEQDPANGEALRALASLLSAEANWVEARRVLERQLEMTQEPTERAAVLTDLARTAWEGFTDGAEAQRLLDEALTLVPNHLPAILAVADIHYKEGQWEAAEKRLTEAVRRLRGQPQQAAKLFQRLAEVHEKLGKLDEAYRQLVEADRMGPGQLLTKLSLGENRFRAGRWREAALHLGGLVDHPDAALYPDEVADALAHAAQAETKLRHPDRAVELYESALKLRGNHRPTLRALAELALEGGEKQKAAIYLRRIAEDSNDRMERAQVFERLGDLLLELDDERQALAAYGDAVKAYNVPGEEQVSLLEKVLKLQRSTGASEAAAQTSALLVELVKDPKERAERRREAALMMAERGSAREAAELLEQALVEDPQDEATLIALCSLGDKLPKNFGLSEKLSRALESLPPPAPDAGSRRRRADLWQRLGELARKKNPTAAIEAFEQVVALDPEQISAREQLAVLYKDGGGSEDAAIDNHRKLLGADVTRADSLRALAAAYARRGEIDRARCCREVLSVLGLATKDEEAFLDAHPSQELKPDDPYAATVEDQDRREHLALPEATLMAEIFSCLWEGAPGLIGQRLEDFGVSGHDKVSPMSDLDLGKIYGQVAKALGNRKTALYVRPDGGPNDEVTIVVQAPPALVVGPHLANGAKAAEVRFQLGRGIELSRPEYILAAGVRPKQFTTLFASVLRAFHPRHARRRATAGDAAAEQAAKLKKNVPYKVSKQLVELFGALGTTSWSSLRWRTVVHHVGNRTGLVLCGDLKTAADIIVKESGTSSNGEAPTPEDVRRLATSYEPLRELLRFAVSEDHFLLREKLGTAIAKAAAA
jgi:tetratricopeptide (TPR) repeat protein